MPREMKEIYLERHAKLPRGLKREVLGPKPGGRWWAIALHGAEDALPWGLCRCGQRYDATVNGTWCKKGVDNDPHERRSHLVRVRLSKILVAGCEVWLTRLEGEKGVPDRPWIRIDKVDQMREKLKGEYKGKWRGIHTMWGEVVQQPLAVPAVYVVGHKGGLALPSKKKRKKS